MSEARETESVNTALLNRNRFDRYTDVANTLMARDYKGFGTSTECSNGVVEWKTKSE